MVTGGRSLLALLVLAAAVARARAGLSGIWQDAAGRRLRLEQRGKEVRVWRGVEEDGRCAKACSEDLATRSAHGFGGSLFLRTQQAPDQQREGRVAPGDAAVSWQEPADTWTRLRAEEDTPSTPRGGLLAYVGRSQALINTRHGNFFIPLADNYVSRSLLYFGEWCEHSLGVLLDLAKPGDFVLDIGANIGTFTVPLAQKVGFGGLVMAFEPQPYVHHLLGANLAMNELIQVQTFLAAASNESGTIGMPILDYNHEHNIGAYSLLDRSFPTNFIVDVRTVDTLPMNGRCPSLMKIDVEGMEEAVLYGAAQTIARCQPIIFCEANDGPAVDVQKAILNKFNYAVYYVVWPYSSKDNFRKETQELLSGYDRNLLAVPSSRVEELDLGKRFVRVKMERDFVITDYREEFLEVGITLAF